MDTAIGQVIGERYRLEQGLSEGPQGQLWRARGVMPPESRAPAWLRV